MHDQVSDGVVNVDVQETVDLDAMRTAAVKQSNEALERQSEMQEDCDPYESCRGKNDKFGQWYHTRLYWDCFSALESPDIDFPFCDA